MRAAAGGTPVVARLLASLEGANSSGRSRVLKLLGRLADGDADAARALVGVLQDGRDERAQRAAANALGRFGGSSVKDEVGRALVVAWDEAPPLPLARALAESLGKLGFAPALERLESVRDGDAELVRLAKNAALMLRREESRVNGGEVRVVAAAGFDVPIVFECRAGVEPWLVEEIAERLPDARDVRERGTGRVSATFSGAPSALFAVRTMLGFAVALPDEPHGGTDEALEAAVVRALASPDAVRVLEAWSSGAVRYRLSWEGRGHRRAATWRVAHALHDLRPGWVNDPTSSTWEARISTETSVVRVLLAPRFEDPRFAYRVGDVPAASHPTLAATLVRATRPHADDVVWDPFVGSATELIERARAGSFRALVGSDLDGAALEVARANLLAAGVEATLTQADATQHAPAGVTCIVTNPPMGRRVARDGSLAELLDAFVDHAARMLVAGGRLVWLSPLGGRTAARAEAAGLTVSLRKSVDMGGFQAELQVCQKRER